ncbi:DNA alkylation repair protein [Paenibacillus urinalis]|uniref:DNA alkylation repair protein n=1 Tax=Paenibacillus urinalis TaxID=521520 RepID=A0AAX3N5B9_9BACL|nr:DNA alkylation repair protein [Paenibacillus urinalis]WDH85026.1 DNA alkylation repair protein [Paenibacillus urinalis]WDH99947.1 DNA alkylation repair protein [Paenibacillus urinalis]WDI04775.1 DNA alkylation repair protein [Paenibacillus urinalis]
MSTLEELGTEQTKKTFLRHGAREPFFGVKVGDMKKKLVKEVKKDQEVAQSLFSTGNSDAMYLAGLTVNPKLVSKELLEAWVQQAYWYMIAEYPVAWLTAESPYATELAMKWIQSDEEMVATAGWSTYSNYVSITPDDELDLGELAGLLERVRSTIHEEQNWVRSVMNGFVISVGSYVQPLHEQARDVAQEIGKVHVDVGNTACKIPLAEEYIRRVEEKGKLFKKRKTCIC